MIKNRTFQLVFQTIYIAFGIIGILASVDFFEHRFDSVFYVYFTNLSNYLCIGIMFFELLQTAKKRRNSYVSFNPCLKFVGVIAIIITALVFNIILAPTRDFVRNFSVESILLHIVLPFMFVLDWILFYKRRQCKWYYPFVSLLSPLIYIIFIYVRGYLVNFNPSTPELFPYFFLDFTKLGVGGVARWFLLFGIGFFVLSYGVYFIDRIFKSRS